MRLRQSVCTRGSTGWRGVCRSAAPAQRPSLPKVRWTPIPGVSQRAGKHPGGGDELERMGGGLRDRMILVDTESLVEGADEVRLVNALRLNYGKIRSLRASLKTNQSIGEVLTRNGHTLDERGSDRRQAGRGSGRSYLHP